MTPTQAGRRLQSVADRIEAERERLYEALRDLPGQKIEDLAEKMYNDLGAISSRLGAIGRAAALD